MARFDVYANPVATERAHTPYVVDVQNDHLGAMATRVVIPLRTPGFHGRPARTLNPSVQVEGRSLILDTASLAPVPAAMLRKPVHSLHGDRGDVLDALDALFGAF